MINGLTIYEEWISEKEEKEIIEQLPIAPVKNTVKRNSIHRWGTGTPYNDNKVSEEIPDYLKELGNRLVEDGLLKESPNSISVNEYLPGQRIDYHVDGAGCGETVIVLSLGSEANMRWKNPPQLLERIIPNRSLLQMQGEARWKWSHCIDAVKQRRWSLVFRNSTK